MKIVHISTSKAGGAGIAAYRAHEGLLKHGNGVESCFIQKSLDPDPENHFYRCTHYHNLYYRIIKKLGLRKLLDKEYKYRRIIKKYPSNYEIITLPFTHFPIEEHPIVKEADIVHLHWVADFLNYPDFFEKIKQPIVWTLHDMNPFLGVFHYEDDTSRNQDTLGLLDKKIYSLKGKYIHQKKDIYIVTPSNWLMNKSEKSPILSKYPHSLVQYGFDISRYPLLNNDECKSKLNINNGRKNILFVAQDVTVRRKGIDLLANALNKIDPTLFNIIAIGSGDIESEVNKDINLLKLDHITNSSELNIAYSAADIVIIPSREDNSPNVMTESLLNGTPVISFSNGGMPEQIRTGENGIIVNDISSEALMNAVNDFLNNKYTFNRNEIRNYAIQNFSDDLQTSRYINLYKQILNKE